MTTTITATPKKLRDGSWGALAKSESVRKGDTVTITTASGKSWSATIERVIWTGNGVAICATASAPKASREPRSFASRSCRGCRGPIVDCSHHRAMGGYCGSCAFDEFDC